MMHSHKGRLTPIEEIDDVLILVVMDDALALKQIKLLKSLTEGLNPCCNG